MSTSSHEASLPDFPTADIKDVSKTTLVRNTTSSPTNKSDDSTAKISPSSPSNQTKPENVTSKLTSLALEKNASLPKLTVEKILHPSLKNNQTEAKDETKEGIYEMYGDRLPLKTFNMSLIDRISLSNFF